MLFSEDIYKTKIIFSAASSYFSCTKQYVMLLDDANSYLLLYLIIIINTLVCSANHFIFHNTLLYAKYLKVERLSNHLCNVKNKK